MRIKEERSFESCYQVPSPLSSRSYGPTPSPVQSYTSPTSSLSLVPSPLGYTRDDWAEQIGHTPPGKVPSSPTFPFSPNNVSKIYYFKYFLSPLPHMPITSSLMNIWRLIASLYIGGGVVQFFSMFTFVLMYLSVELLLVLYKPAPSIQSSTRSTCPSLLSHIFRKKSVCPDTCPDTCRTIEIRMFNHHYQMITQEQRV